MSKRSLHGLGLFLAVAIFAGWFLTGCFDTEKPLKYSTIHEAAAKGDLEDVKNHLRRGTAVNARDWSGMTPLHYAAKFNQVKVAKFLIKKGADINEAAIEGYTRRSYTPLKFAAEEGHKEMVKLLIRNGANISIDAINKMLDKGHIEIAFDMAKILKPLPEEDSWTMLKDIAFWSFSRKGSAEVTTILIKKADIEAITSALSTAVWAGNAEFAELLLKHGAGIKMKDNLLHHVFDTGGYTDRPRDINIVKVLLKYEVDINAKDENGYSPLHKVIINWGGLQYEYVKGELKEFVKLLIEKGADVNATDKKGNTPLHWVAQLDSFDRYLWAEEIVPMLIKSGADINARNKHGETPLRLALQGEHSRTVEVLRKYGAKE